MSIEFSYKTVVIDFREKRVINKEIDSTKTYLSAFFERIINNNIKPINAQRQDFFYRKNNFSLVSVFETRIFEYQNERKFAKCKQKTLAGENQRFFFRMLNSANYSYSKTIIARAILFSEK